LRMNDDVHDGDELLSHSMPEDWGQYLVRNVAHFRLLNSEERARLCFDTQKLIAAKYWEGCGGQQVTDEVKVTIAAQACLMLLGMEHDCFSRVQSVLVYPSGFLIPTGDWMDDYEEAQAADGQAVYRGPVILAWDAVQAEGQDPSSGNNVVIHEFAHQLDYLDGYINGTPELASEDQDQRWRQVMTSEYSSLVRAVRRGHNTLLGEHAARIETEFFAVASERFFTVPERLKRYHRALYDVLAEFYALDPIKWFARAE